ncbi:hypothetical protein MtrunA17_Chr1g0192861 [Medicago truncatula]|uniref:Uncharacterized protein n=1 Tax=Medicago truncatula TaxID=3880 RepID=A0A396JRF2_MEDTR|nr:hypothetical protein MtrunA17_Chr1g0192861 [Medicago truncatula]
MALTFLKLSWSEFDLLLGQNKEEIFTFLIDLLRIFCFSVWVPGFAI